jgi:hypothetical protein
MNNVDYNSDVCTKDGYGNVTALNQNGHGNDIRDESDYKGYTIDAGIMTIVWCPDDSWFGKFSSVAAAKAAIDAAL